MTVQVVILAAGVGSRLGGSVPKALTPLADGRTIMQQQLDAIEHSAPGARVHVVVGHKAPLLLEAHPEVLFVYNECYDTTNTAKSLLRALELVPDGDVLWMNGDVVLHPAVPELVLGDRRTSAVAVNTAAVGAEEVKYRLDDDGFIERLSKTVEPAAGEAVGVNLVVAADRPAMQRRLVEVEDTDYFERAVELTIARDGARYRSVDISDLYAIEVDFAEDLDRANARLGTEPPPLPDASLSRAVP